MGKLKSAAALSAMLASMVSHSQCTPCDDNTDQNCMALYKLCNAQEEMKNLNEEILRQQEQMQKMQLQLLEQQKKLMKK